jgi:hypothetical protein
MKKLLSISILLIVVMGIKPSNAQNIPTYPIPSYNVDVNGYANFREGTTTQTLDSPEEKRVVNIEVRVPTSNQDCQATVWIYTLDYTTVLGPYTVNCNEPLSVTIDDRKWGVLVETNETLSFSVWFS